MSLLFRDVKDLGPLTTEFFYNQSGLKLQSYVWFETKNANGETIDPKGIVVAIHGVTSHVKFEFLNHKTSTIATTSLGEDLLKERAGQETSCPYPRYFSYEDSWPEAFNRNGYIFCSYDQQGHGCSESWMESRCNVESFDHLAFDALQFIIRVNRLYGTHPTTGRNCLPTFLLGVSMGGGVVLRTLSLYSFILKHRCIPPYTYDEALTDVIEGPKRSGTVARMMITTMEECTSNSSTNSIDDQVSVTAVRKLPRVNGIVMCPNISLDSITKKTVNRLLLPLSRPISWFLPHIRVGALATNVRFPWIEDDRIADAKDEMNGIYNNKIPARMAYQNILLCSRIAKDVSLLQDDEKELSQTTREMNGPTVKEAEEPKEDGHIKSISHSDNSSTDAADKQRANSSQYRLNPKSSLRPCQYRRGHSLSLLLIHSKNDTMTDPSGSINLHNRAKELMQDVQLWLLDNMWHYLTLEEGNEKLRDRIIKWMHERCDLHRDNYDSDYSSKPSSQLILSENPQPASTEDRSGGHEATLQGTSSNEQSAFVGECISSEKAANPPQYIQYGDLGPSSLNYASNLSSSYGEGGGAK